MLLLPENLIKDYFYNTIPCLKALEKVAETFEMSFEATANKCTKYGSKPFALIYSKNDIVRYCWKDHKRLPYYSLLKKGSAMPAKSQALTLQLPDKTISPFSKTNALDWFKANSKYKLPNVLIEQTYFQTKGYKVTLLMED